MNSKPTQNPYAPPSIDESADHVDKSLVASPATFRNTKWDLLLLLAIVLVAVVGAVAAVADIESIIFSGPALVIVALAILLRDLVCRRRGGHIGPLPLILAISSLAFAVAVFFLIYWNSWSPSDAENFGVQYVVAGFSVWVLLCSWRAWWSISRHEEQARRTYA